MVARSRADRRVRLTGRAEQIWPHLADADVFVLASPSEALGIAIMEAMAAGLPVVASDVGGIPELVTPGVTGELFAVRDHAALARQLVDLLRSPQRRARCPPPRCEAAEAMRMQESVEAYFGLYDRLIHDGPPPAAGEAGPRRVRGSSR